MRGARWWAGLAFGVLLTIATPMRAFDQSVTPGAYEGRSISAIYLEGPTAPTAEQFSTATGIRQGEPYSAANIRRMLELLYRSGDYTDVRVDAESREGGVALTVSFVPRLRLKAFELRGHHQPTARLREIVALRTGDELTEANVHGAVERLKAWYRDLGYLVEISSSTRLEDNKTTARIIFDITERDRVRIRGITVPGSPAFSRFRHLLALRSAVGEYYSRDHFEKGITRLVDLYHDHGYLKAVVGPPDVGLSPRGVTVSIPIQHGPHYRVVVEGHPGVRTGTLIDQLTLFQDPRDDEASLNDDAERLTEFLSDQGFRNASVQIRREVEREDKIIIRVIVEAGTRLGLTTVEFEGNQSASVEELSTLVTTIPSSWWKSQYIERNRLEADRDRLETWYRGRGFLEAKVTVAVTEDLVRRSVRITFHIVEGPQTLIGTVRIDGNQAFPTDTLLKQANLPQGSPYVESRLRTARAALLAFYSEHGYLYSTVEATAQFSADHIQADITVAIDEGVQVTTGAITLSGNTRTRDHVIFRELEVRTGDVYNPRKVLESQRRIARLGFLSEVRLESVNPEQHEKVKDLRLTVKDRNAGTVDFGGGYANYEGLRGFAEIAYRNIAGTGRRISLREDVSRLERRSVLSYFEPWVLGYRIDGRAALGAEQVQEQNRGYQRTTYGVGVALLKTLSPALKFSIGYDYQRNQYEGLNGLDLTDPQNTLTEQDLDRANFGAITPTLTRDTRDDPFNPRSGSVNSITVRDAARILASENQFWKVTVSSAWYRALSSFLVGAVSLRGGVANRFGETDSLPLSERYYLGGRSTVRGYAEDTLGPIDPNTGNPTGGNAMFVGNLELRVGLPRALGMVFFVDSGNIWPEFPDVKLSEVKTTVGSGIRYNTPVGPLRFDYGHKLNWQPGESHGEYHFTLGHAF